MKARLLQRPKERVTAHDWNLVRGMLLGGSSGVSPKATDPERYYTEMWLSQADDGYDFRVSVRAVSGTIDCVTSVDVKVTDNDIVLGLPVFLEAHGVARPYAVWKERIERGVAELDRRFEIRSVTEASGGRPITRVVRTRANVTPAEGRTESEFYVCAHESRGSPTIRRVYEDTTPKDLEHELAHKLLLSPEDYVDLGFPFHNAAARPHNLSEASVLHHGTDLFPSHALEIARALRLRFGGTHVVRLREDVGIRSRAMKVMAQGTDGDGRAAAEAELRAAILSDLVRRGFPAPSSEWRPEASECKPGAQHEEELTRGVAWILERHALGGILGKKKRPEGPGPTLMNALQYAVGWDNFYSALREGTFEEVATYLYSIACIVLANPYQRVGLLPGDTAPGPFLTWLMRPRLAPRRARLARGGKAALADRSWAVYRPAQRST